MQYWMYILTDQCMEGHRPAFRSTTMPRRLRPSCYGYGHLPARLAAVARVRASFRQSIDLAEAALPASRRVVQSIDRCICLTPRAAASLPPSLFPLPPASRPPSPVRPGKEVRGRYIVPLEGIEKLLVAYRLVLALARLFADSSCSMLSSLPADPVPLLA